MANDKNSNTLMSMTKSNVWEYQENDIISMWQQAEKDSEVIENYSHYLMIVRTAFEIEPITIDKPEVIKKYESRGMLVAELSIGGEHKKWAVKKRPILRVTDLTYENIRHITAAKLLEVIDKNFGGGWESLSQSIKDIIESGFDISTTCLPKNRLHKPGGLYEKKIDDGFEVLEIEKGSWVEAIFAKMKPASIKIKGLFVDDELDNLEDVDNEDEDVDIKDDYYKNDDDDDEFDEDKLTEESYRTTFEEDPEELGMRAEELGDDIYDE